MLRLSFRNKAKSRKKKKQQKQNVDIKINHFQGLDIETARSQCVQCKKNPINILYTHTSESLLT